METLLQVSEEVRNVWLSICLTATRRKPTENIREKATKQCNRSGNKKWWHGEQNKRIIAAATIN